MSRKPISEETRDAILAAAWDLIAVRGQADIGQGEIAATAGVSRQTVFYAFGNRAGLLEAMVAHHDDTSAVFARLMEIARTRDRSIETLLGVISAWLDYMPEIYPVASLLDAAALTDADARKAIESRMIGRLLNGLIVRLKGMAAAGTLAQNKDPLRLAETIWEMIHLPAWRLLVVDRGWSAEEFRENRLALIRHLVSTAA